MTHSNFSVSEVLRSCHPETDLEKRLFELLEKMHNATSDALAMLSADNIEGAWERLEEGESGIR